MAVPVAARDVVAAVGAVLVLTAAVGVVGTLIVPRSVASWLLVVLLTLLYISSII